MEETKWLTKTKLIILAVIIVIIIVTISVIIIRKDRLKKEYIQYENQLEYAANNYLLKEKISLKDGEYREIKVSDILKQKLITNKRSSDCDGYVIAKQNKETTDCKAYITCKNIYKTDGYGTKITTGKINTEEPQTQKDTEKPVITLFGDEKITLTVGDKYEELKATAMDNVDGDLTDKIKISGSVNTSKAGTYIITYTVSDTAKNKETKERTIIIEEKKEEEKKPQQVTPTPVPTPTPSPTPTPTPTPTKDTTQPIISFTNSLMQKIYVGSKVDISQNGIYGYSAWDNVDGNITNKVVITGSTGIINTPGTYSLYYSVSDSSGNNTTVSRQFIVIEQPNIVPPSTKVINVTGISVTPNKKTLSVGMKYTLNISIQPSDATDKTVTYTSTNPSVATVDSSGVVNALRKGTTKINVISNSNNKVVGQTEITVQ